LGFVLPRSTVSYIVLNIWVPAASPSRFHTYVLYVLNAPRVAVTVGMCRGEAQERFVTARASCVGGVSTE
jgi:hypothetical protein